MVVRPKKADVYIISGYLYMICKNLSQLLGRLVYSTRIQMKSSSDPSMHTFVSFCKTSMGNFGYRELPLMIIPCVMVNTNFGGPLFLSKQIMTKLLCFRESQVNITSYEQFQCLIQSCP